MKINHGMNNENFPGVGTRIRFTHGGLENLGGIGMDIWITATITSELEEADNGHDNGMIHIEDIKKDGTLDTVEEVFEDCSPNIVYNVFDEDFTWHLKKD